MVFDTTPKYNYKSLSKWDFRAREFRNLGNQCYNAKRFDPSTTLRYYNMAIAYAQSKEEAALGYANRSATFLEREYYKECLENIQLAREHGYPADKMAKLDEREAKCKKLMAKKEEEEEDPDENPWIVFELSHPANKHIPFIVDCVELKKTYNGYGIYASKDLKPGDVISVEESAIYFLRDESYYERCFNCYKTNSLNLIPCDKTASIMFCSKECKESTYKKAINMDKIMCDDVKLLSELISAFGSKKKFVKYLNSIKDLKDQKKTIFDFDLSNPEDPDYKKNLMMCLLSSAIKYDESPNHFCWHTCNIKDLLPLDIVEKLIEILHTNNELEPFLANMHQGKRDFEYSKTNPCDPSIPLFAGLIKRGRAGNVFSVLPGNKIAVIVMKPIKKGREIFFSSYDHLELLGYGNNHDYDNVGILNFDWDMLDDYTEVKTYFKEEWKFIKSGSKIPSIDCYPTASIEAFKGIASICSLTKDT